MNKRLRWYDHFAVNAYVLGLSLGSGIITPLLLPYLVLLFMGPEYKNTFLTVVRNTGLLVAMFVQPVAGLLSDRSASRFGRRRPFIFVSGILNVAFLAIIGLSPAFRDARFAGISAAFLILLAGTIVLQFSSNIGQAAVQGIMPDVTPPPQRGFSSGVKSVYELVPSLLVFLLGIGSMIDAGRTWPVVLILMGGYLVTMLVNVFLVKECPAEQKPSGAIREQVLRALALTVLFGVTTLAATLLVSQSGAWITRLSASLAVKIGVIGLIGLAAMAASVFIGVYYGAWIGIGKQAQAEKPFIWWVVNRLLFLAAVGSIQAFALYFLSDVLRLPNAGRQTTLLLAVVGLFLLPSALIAGGLSNRVGLKRMVLYAGLVAALGTVALIFSRSISMVMASGTIIGVAAGAFMASNWALGTRLVPPQDAGRYLGISNLAGAGAGIVGAGIGGPLADLFNHVQGGLGYLVVFGIYAGLFLISSLTLARVRLPSAGASG